MRSFSLLSAALAFAPLAAVAAPGGSEVDVTAGAHGCRRAVARVVLPYAPTAAQRRGGQASPVQVRKVAGGYEAVWVIDGMLPDERRVYQLVRGGKAPEAAGMKAAKVAGGIEVRAGDRLLTKYDTATGPNKPYLYPLLAPDGTLMVRQYPLAKVEGESADHPHHRGLWWTHGAVNGGDYWSETSTKARTVDLTTAQKVESGPVFARFTTATDWIGADGAKVGVDTREVTVYAPGDVLDFVLTFTAGAARVTFGDTKEGSFGVRLPDEMIVDRGKGHIVTSTGIMDGKAWGVRAPWVDCYGPVSGKTMGMAMADHPANPRFPTWWHVRTYGLFAANPFGIHDFEKGKPAGSGDMVVEAGESITFRYRVYLHAGEPDGAGVAEVCGSFIDPPRTVVRAR